MTFKCYVRLLALAYKPKGGTSILAWSPFAKDTLGKIVDDHNDRTIQTFGELRMLEDDIETLGEGISIVPHDLSTVGELRIKDFADIVLLLADVDTIQDAPINKIKALMARNPHAYKLLQVSRKPNAVSCRTLFEPLPVIPSRPEILLTQEDLEERLRDFSEMYVLARLTIGTPLFTVGNDPEDKEIMQAYVEAVPRIAGHVRDAAMAQGVPKESIRAFAPQVAMREFFPARLAEQVRTPHAVHVNVDAIRERVAETTTAAQSRRLRLKPVKLVMCNLNRPMVQLTTKQRDLAIDLGIKGKGFGTVQLDDQMGVWDKIGSLGDVVEVKKFSADLPSGFLRGIDKLV